MDYYKIIISPETIQGDLSKVDYKGQEVGVYSAMTQVVTGGTNGDSILTGLTIPILFRESINDVGYFSPFDGALVQQNVVTNFLFSATTDNPYTYYVYNTSDEYQKFLELSSYVVDWGDGTPVQKIESYAPNNVSHTYATVNSGYTITLKQTNPWGLVEVSKDIKTPYQNVVNFNPQGTVYFTSNVGNWSATPINYNFIFSGDANNTVSAQTSNNYTTIPFIVSGLTKSRLTELAQYGYPPYPPPGAVVIKNGEVFGVIDKIEPDSYTAYTIQNISFYDFQDGITIFSQGSSGLTEDNIVAVPIVKEEVLLNVVDQPQIQTNVFVERGKNSAYEKIQRLGEVDNLGDLLNYGYGFFNVEKKS